MFVLLGAGVRNLALDEMAKLGASRVVVITTPGRAEHAAHLGVPVLALAQAQVPRQSVERALEQLGDADGVLAFGGGTATGLGKAIAFDRDVIFGAIPTTYAGSEMTDIWASSTTEGKTTARDTRVLPKLVVYDPELTLDLPVDTSIASGLNAMAHAVDASWNDPDDELRTDCINAIAGWVDTLPRLVDSPRDPQLREDALNAARLSGMALQRGTMGLQHQLAHVLGGTFGLPHAETHAVLLPHVIGYNQAHAERLETVLGADPATRLFLLMQEIGAPTKLDKSFPVDDVVQRVLRDPYPNPELMDAARLTALLQRAMEGRPPE